jgi:ubiquinone/menaquinone biosynthesis C-methylase UbiE
MSLASIAPQPLVRAAYRTQHDGMLLSLRTAHQLVRFLTNERIERDPELEAETLRRYRKLLRDDLANVEAGYYPRSLLFGFPYREYLKNAPKLLADIPRTVLRKKRQNHEDLPNDVDLTRYPAYYRRNFHWQTGGYFTLDSAIRYDIGVELLFLGTADVMRRMAIPPVSRLVAERGDDLRVLDVACGTGGFLRLLGGALPRLDYTGLDLSEAYLAYARERCQDVPRLNLVQGNAEEMPFRDRWFDVVTSVYLFHELPKDARRNAMREMLRVLKPGGLLVIEDSAQLSDSGELARVLANFANDFHEPYYKGYIRDDLADALEEVGFDVEESEAHMVAKVVVARKPA